MLGIITKRKSIVNTFENSLEKNKKIYNNLKKEINFLNNIYWCFNLRFDEPSSIQDINNSSFAISNLIDDLKISAKAILSYYKHHEKYLKNYNDKINTILNYPNNIVEYITLIVKNIEDINNYKQHEALLNIHKNLLMILDYMHKEKTNNKVKETTIQI